MEPTSSKKAPKRYLNGIFIVTLGWLGLLALAGGLIEWLAFFVGGQAALHGWESALIPWIFVALQAFAVLFLAYRIEDALVKRAERKAANKALDEFLAQVDALAKKLKDAEALGTDADQG